MWVVVMGLYLMGGIMPCSALAGGEMSLRFHLDPDASHVWFDADARLFRFRGQTRQMHGGFILTQTAPPQISEAQVIIDAASLDTGHTERDADMHQDFLEVEKFPTIEFVVLDLQMARPVADRNMWDVVLNGQLTIHGVSRMVRVPTTVSLAPQGITAQGQIHLDMRDFDIRVPRRLLIPMKSEVLVGFEILARPEP